MLTESHPLIRRLLRLIALPYCYIYLVNWEECTVSRLQVMKDLFYIFFKLKYFPDNYSPCRFWEKDREEWTYYYGSSYDPWQRYLLRKKVQPYRYLMLFDDKEVCNLLTQGIGDINMPKYYGVISQNMDYREWILEILNENMLTGVIIKPVLGRAGQGISMAYIEDGTTKVKTGKSISDLSEFELSERCIVQEVIKQHEKVAEISRVSVNTIRAVTLYTTVGEAIVISASIRFGVGESFIDNWSAGGIAAGVDHNTGIVNMVAYDKYGKRYHQHPESGIQLEGFQIPYWPDIVSMAIKVQKAFPFFKLLGMDIAITEDGPVLIEINPSTDLIFQEQTAGPLLKDKRTWLEFVKYDILVNQLQKKLY